MPWVARGRDERSAMRCKDEDYDVVDVVDAVEAVEDFEEAGHEDVEDGGDGVETTGGRRAWVALSKK